MSERIVKYRLITFFTDEEDPTAPGGMVRREHVAHLGQKVEIPDSEIERLERTSPGSLYTEEEEKAIEAGEYTGFDRHTLAAARAGVRPQSRIEPVDGEGADVSGMDAEQLGEYIKENKLTVAQTLALLPEDADEDTINRLYDAEGYATENEPRKGVTDTLDAKLAAAAAA